MHGEMAGTPVERENGRRLSSWQQVGDPLQGLARRIEHDVLGFLGCEHALDAAEEVSGEASSALIKRLQGANEQRLAVEDLLDCAKAVGLQRRTSGNEIADGGRDLEARRKLDGTVHLHDFCLDASLVEKALEQPWIGRGDTLTGKRVRSVIGQPLRHGEPEAALAESKLGEDFEAGRGLA